MLRFFQNNRFGSSLLLFVYALVLRIPSFLDPGISLEEHSLIVDKGILDLFGIGWISQVIVAFIIFVEAAMVNRIAIRNRLYHEINLYPGVMYILLLSFTPANYHFHLFLIVNFIALLSLMELFHVYKIINSKGKIFNIGILASINVCLSIPFFIFYFFYWISLSSLRSFKLQEIIQLILGYLAPLFVFAVAYFWFNENFQGVTDKIIQSFGFASLYVISKPWDYIIYAFFILAMIVFILSYTSQISKKNIQGMKKINILYWFLLFGILSALFQSNVSLSQLIIIAIPMSVFLGMNFSKIQNIYVRELLHLMIFAASIFINVNVLLSI